MQNTSELKKIFDDYFEESVTWEQAHRVLVPVVLMIKAGMFEKQSISGTIIASILISLFISAAICIVIGFSRM